MGFVYFARHGSLVKIGFTQQRPKSRVGRYRILALFDGTVEDEVDCHRALDQYRVQRRPGARTGPRRELFLIPEEVVRKIVSYGREHGVKNLIDFVYDLKVLHSVYEFCVQRGAPKYLLDALSKCIREY